MTRWVVVFNDTPGMLDHRKQFGREHIAYLEKHSKRILSGGGLRAAPEAPFCGGLWIVEAPTHHDVVELVTNDPYFNPSHRRFEIFAWGKAIDKEVLI